MRIGSIITLAVFSGVILAGCAGALLPKSPPMQYHQLDYAYKKVDVPCRALSNRIIKVWPFHATSPFDSSEMVVEDGKLNVMLSRTHQWIDKPGALIAEWIRKDIDRDGVFAGAFETIEVSREVGMELSGVVEKWSLVKSADSYSAKMAVTITVWQKQPRPEIIFKKHFALEEPVHGSTRDPEAFAQAMSKLASRISEDLRKEFYHRINEKFCPETNAELRSERRRTEP